MPWSLEVIDCLSIILHESRATSYKPRFCIWLRVILPSRTCCWTPPPVTYVTRILNLRGVAWPQEPREKKRRWNHSTWSGTKAYISLSGVPEGVPPAIGKGREHLRKQCRLCVSWLFLSRGIVTSMIPYWSHQGSGHPILCRKSTFLFYLSCDSNWDVCMIQYENKYRYVPYQIGEWEEFMY